MRFFLLVFGLSVPFWLAGAATEFQVLPGLPVSAFMFVCPGAAACILVSRESGLAGVAGLLRRSFRIGPVRSFLWYVPAFLLMPVIMVLSYRVLLWSGTPIPPPAFSARTVLLLLVLFFVSATGEEIGWTGYATDPLQRRGGAVTAGILLGLVSAVWHVVPLLQAQRSAVWIAWWALWTMSGRILIVWLYNKAGGSVLAAIVFHMMTNVSWQLFPVNGSRFDPRVTGLIEAAAAVTVVAMGLTRRPARGEVRNSAELKNGGRTEMTSGEPVP